jgi:hypothetical protein
MARYPSFGFPGTQSSSVNEIGNMFLFPGKMPMTLGDFGEGDMDVAACAFGPRATAMHSSFRKKNR